eukprot:scaffold607440_cov20-Prasinocladus_malaysianus.AAC.1
MAQRTLLCIKPIRKEPQVLTWRHGLSVAVHSLPMPPIEALRARLPGKYAERHQRQTKTLKGRWQPKDAATPLLR